MRRAALCTVAILILGCGLLVGSWLSPRTLGLSRAAAGAPGLTGGQKVAFFEDVTVGPGESWNNIVVVGGDLVVQGAVINGVVVVGGDVTVRSGGSVGHSPPGNPDDAAIVCVFGRLTIEPGAMVSGRTIDVAGGTAATLHDLVVDPVVRPWTFVSAIGWIGSTVFIMIVAVIVAAIAPRQLVYASRRAQRHSLSSLGWGALLLFIGVPLSLILLAVTVIGIVVAVPWLFIGVPVALLFGYVSVGTLLGRLIVGGDTAERSRVMLAAVIGVLILSVLRWIPFAGSIIVLLALLMGFGALFTGLWEWRRRPRGPAPQIAGPGGHILTGSGTSGPPGAAEARPGPGGAPGA